MADAGLALVYAEDLAEEEPAEKRETGGVVVVVLNPDEGYGSGKAEGSGKGTGEGIPVKSFLPDDDLRIVRLG